KTAYEITRWTGVQTCALPIYSPETEIKAGRVFGGRESGIGNRGPATRSVKIGPNATPDLLASIDRMAEGVNTVIVTAYVRRVEEIGRASCRERGEMSERGEW